MKIIKVVAGVILDNDKVLITRRAPKRKLRWWLGVSWRED